MVRKTLLIALMVALLSACSTASKTEKGAAIGAGSGAAVGAIIGQAMGRNTASTLIGAGVGAVVGGVTGGVIGNYMDKQEAEMRQTLSNMEAASVQREADVLAVTFRSDVFFDVNSAQLKPGGFDEISRVAGVLQRYPQTTIQVEGYTDSTGTEQYNQELSLRRAEAVQTALVGQGVNPARIRTIGYGESLPVASNDNPGGRQLNRRVRIVITPNQNVQG